MVPSKALMLRLRLVSRLRRPSSGGRPPLKLLLDSWSLASQVRLAMQGAMEPEMPWDSRSSATTRLGAVAPQEIPCQSQNSMDVLLHEARAPVGANSPDLKQRSACLSLSDSSHMPRNGRLQKKPKKRQRN
ncbi:hypothetical protein ZWY2020_035467 [Hordeum vulgare]|nr:hypothetical protein ZWY2020_035467 [Hordeum vulgare]